ncbi:MAG: response regulator [Gemmatimonadetes bacterium]|jgi:signal transduction histidine kinase|nr:response regulator [Gemmatimonadota bacterium]MBT7862014.1 response regulator [Gemmatimonadota bacterium]
MPPIDYPSVFSSLPMPATLVDGEGTVVDINEACVRSMHRQGHDTTRESCLGRRIWETVSDGDPLSSREVVLGFLSGQSLPPLHHRSTGADGDTSTLHEISVTALPQGGAIIVREEITEREAQAERLQETSRFLQAYASVGRMVLESLDLEEILDAMPRELVQAGVFRSLMIAVVDEQRSFVEVQRSFVREVDEHGRIIPGSAIRPNGNMNGRRFLLTEDNPTPTVARTGEIVLERGEEPRRATTNDESMAHVGTRIRVSIFFPVKAGDHVIAVLATAAAAEDQDQLLAHIRAMRPLLDQAAIAIQHARFYARIRASEAAARVRLGVERVRNSILQMERDSDWTRVVTTLAEEIGGLVEGAGCGLNLVRDDQVYSYSIGPGLSESMQDSPIPAPVTEALRTQDAIYRRDQSQMRRSGDLPVLFEADIRSVIDIPFSTGTLAINSQREDAFPPEIIDALWLYATTIGEGHRRLEDLRALAVKERQLQQAQKMEAVGQLTAGVAHNFNNLLQAMVGELDLAMLETERSEANELIEGALDAARRAAHLVHQLLLYSRQNQPGDLASTDPLHILNDVEAICRRTFDRRIDLDIHLDIDADIRVIGDPMQLEQVLLNLCINARDAVEEAEPAQPRIGILLEKVQLDGTQTSDGIDPGHFLRMEVSDNGAGMDEKTRSRIFDPFFTTKAVGRGTGLGLSTALAIMQDHGGWLRCDSEAGQGARFSAYLPMTIVEADEPMAQTQDTDVDGGQETILIIDDEEMVRTTASRMLKRRGYAVLEAEDGQSGLETYRAHRDDIRLILLDHSMPRMSGREVLAQLRAEDTPVRIVIITGVPAGLEDFEGADDLMEKPFSLKSLVGRVREVLDRPRP